MFIRVNIALQKQVDNVVDISSSGICGDSDPQLQPSTVAAASAFACASSLQPQTLGLISQPPPQQRIYLKPLRSRSRQRHHSHSHNQHHHPAHRPCFPQSAALFSRFRRQSKTRTPTSALANANAQQFEQREQQPMQTKQLRQQHEAQVGGGVGNAWPQRTDEERRELNSPSRGGSGGGGGGQGGEGRHRHMSAQAAQGQEAPEEHNDGTRSPHVSPYAEAGARSRQTTAAPLASFENSVMNSPRFGFGYPEANPTQPPESMLYGAGTSASTTTPYAHNERATVQEPADIGQEEPSRESDDPSTDCQVCESRVF